MKFVVTIKFSRYSSIAFSDRIQGIQQIFRLLDIILGSNYNINAKILFCRNEKPEKSISHSIEEHFAVLMNIL